MTLAGFVRNRRANHYAGAKRIMAHDLAETLERPRRRVRIASMRCTDRLAEGVPAQLVAWRAFF